MPLYILTDDGVPVLTTDVVEWGRWFETHERRLAFDRLPTCDVSTVFLGIDHAWTKGPPVLWETMVFGGKLDGEQQRYTSQSAALLGHREIVSRCRREG